MGHVRSLLALGLVATLAGCSLKNSSDAVAPIQPSFSAAAGLAVYQQNCFSCHGSFESSNIRDKNYDEITAALGRPAMSSIRLPETDLRNLTLALRTDVDALAPERPTTLTVSVLGPTGLALQWTAVQDNAGGSGMKAYHVFRNGTEIAEVDAGTLNHSDQLLTPSTSYSYEVQAEDQMGNFSAKSAAVSATTAAAPVTPDTTAPPLPGGLTVTAKSPTRLEVRWQAVTDETGGSGLKGYRLFRNDVYVTDLSPSALVFLDKNLAANSPYKYQVSAQDNANNESAKGAGVTTSTLAINVAQLYTNRCQTCHSAYATSDVRNQSAAEISAAISTVSSMSGLNDLGDAEVAALANYLVLAPDTTAPTAPTSLSAVASSFSQINLSWSASTDATGVTGYRIYRGGTQIADVAGNVLTYANTGLTASTSYSYQVEARDAAGNVSAKSAAATTSTPAQPATPDTTPPPAPAAPTTAVLSATRIRINWVAASDNAGGSGIAFYRLRRNGTQIGQFNSATLTYTDVNLPDGSSFIYTLVAVDNANNVSAASANANASTPVANGVTLYANRCASCHNPLATSTKIGRSAAQITGAISGTGAPSQMASLTDLGTDEIAAIATALAPAPDTTAPTVPGGLAGLAASATRINVSWNASTDTGGSGLKAYQLYLGNTLLATINQPDTSYAHMNLTPLTSYSYKVRAVDNANNLSAFSAAITKTTPDVPPAPDTTKPSVPATLTATATSNSVTLTWTASTDNTGGTGVVSYKVYKGTVFLKNVSAPALTTSDTGLVSSTAYSYQVSAVDGAGNESNKSTARSITTLPPDPAVVYAARCASCHASFTTSNLKNRYPTAVLFSTAFNNAIRPVANGGIAEMQGRTLTAAELAAIAAVLAGEDTDPGGGDDGAFRSVQPVGTRTYAATLLKQIFVNVEAPTANDNSILSVIDSVVGRNPALGGACTRYDSAACPANNGTHSVYSVAPQRPNQNVVRAGYLTAVCSQVLSVGVATTNALAEAGLTTASPANEANLREVYSLFFPFRTAEAGVISNLSSVHAQAIAKPLPGGDAWRLVLLPLCESAVGGGL